jgi:Uma2 family endonuclease
MSANATMTAAEYLAWSEEGDRTQLVEGEVIVNEPKPIHAALQARLAFELEAWTRSGEGRGLLLLPTDVVMDDFNVFGPDVLWIAERHRPADLSERLARVPDICIEVRSPGTWRYDIGAKKRVYERGGLPELWLVDDVAATVFVFRRSRAGAQFDVALELTGGDQLGSPQLPGFDLPLERLFLKG